MKQMLKPFSNYLSIAAFLILFMVPFSAELHAQLQEDFSDGNFTINPTWTGDVNKFKVNSNLQLQLDDNAESSSFLSTGSNLPPETEWQIWVKCSFSPSANNNTRIYLLSDMPNLKDPLNGYFIQLGESGSSDAIELYRQSGQTESLICRGSDGLIASSFAIRLKVTRNNSGNWKVFADPSGNENFILQAEGFDNQISEGEYFGVLCNYTVSNSNKMYYDDIFIGDIQYDTVPPGIERISVISLLETDIHFTEAVKPDQAGDPANYLLMPGNIQPQYAFTDDEDPALVHLYFENELVSGSMYELRIEELEDYAGNVAENLTANFSYYKPVAYDVVINEIMADPNPPVGIPEYEYLELANNTGFDIDLSGWKLLIGDSEKIIDNATISADAYLNLAHEEAAAELSFFGPFYGFSGFSLTNSGQEVRLYNQYNELISSAAYEDTWYRDPEKEEGGWSLEQIDQYNPCCGKNNWKASVNPAGGTPGSINSVDEDIAEPPMIGSVGFIDKKGIRLNFSQKMDSNSILNPEAYEVSKGIGHPEKCESSSELYTDVVLHLSKKMQSGVVYEIELTDTLLNCVGIELLQEEIIQTGVPATAEEKDVVINEILFNPVGESVDYVEIYNRSGKIIDLSRFRIMSVTENYPNPPDTNSAALSIHTRLMFPESYLVLAESPEKVKQHFFTKNPNAFIAIENFPKLNNDEGTVILNTYEGPLIDKVAYSEEMQHPLLNYYDGVALERINYNRPSSDMGNWQSAAEDVGFGTPAYQNSQFVPEIEIEDPISIEPEIFSPDGDGVDDVLNIRYDFEEAGYTANVSIFDSRGRKIKTLANNRLIGSSGFFSWKGMDENNRPAEPGIYVIYFEVFDTSGQVEKYKKTGVLGRKY